MLLLLFLFLLPVMFLERILSLVARIRARKRAEKPVMQFVASICARSTPSKSSHHAAFFVRGIARLLHSSWRDYRRR